MSTLDKLALRFIALVVAGIVLAFGIHTAYGWHVEHSVTLEQRQAEDAAILSR